jgi:hypothetical protein
MRDQEGQEMKPLTFLVFMLIARDFFGADTCAQMASKDNKVFERTAPIVRSVTEKIVRQVTFSKRELDAMPLEEIHDLAISGYSFGFVASLEPKKNLKADFLARAQKSLRDITRDLSPKDSTFVDGMISKIMVIISKSIDRGYSDGSKPCPLDLPITKEKPM